MIAIASVHTKRSKLANGGKAGRMGSTECIKKSLPMRPPTASVLGSGKEMIARMIG